MNFVRWIRHLFVPIHVLFFQRTKCRRTEFSEPYYKIGSFSPYFMSSSWFFRSRRAHAKAKMAIHLPERKNFSGKHWRHAIDANFAEKSHHHENHRHQVAVDAGTLSNAIDMSWWDAWISFKWHQTQRKELESIDTWNWVCFSCFAAFISINLKSINTHLLTQCNTKRCHHEYRWQIELSSAQFPHGHH